MVIKSSPGLMAFYLWWRDAADPLTLTTGLCTSLEAWREINPQSYNIRAEMFNQFYAARLDLYTPFNDGLDGYSLERRKKAMRANPARQSWVHARIADGVKDATN